MPTGNNGTALRCVTTVRADVYHHSVEQHKLLNTYFQPMISRRCFCSISYRGDDRPNTGQASVFCHFWRVPTKHVQGVLLPVGECSPRMPSISKMCTFVCVQLSPVTLSGKNSIRETCNVGWRMWSSAGNNVQVAFQTVTQVNQNCVL